MKKIVINLLLIAAISIYTLDEKPSSTKSQEFSNPICNDLFKRLNQSQRNNFLSEVENYPQLSSEQNCKNAFIKTALGEIISDQDNINNNSRVAAHIAALTYLTIIYDREYSLEYIDIFSRSKNIGTCYKKPHELNTILFFKNIFTRGSNINKDIIALFGPSAMEEIINNKKPNLNDPNHINYIKSADIKADYIVALRRLSLFIPVFFIPQPIQTIYAILIMSSFLYQKELKEKIKQEAYTESVKILTENKDTVLKIAKILEKKKSIATTEEIEELYTICGKKRPLYPWEQNKDGDL